MVKYWCRTERASATELAEGDIMGSNQHAPNRTGGRAAVPTARRRPYGVLEPLRRIVIMLAEMSGSLWCKLATCRTASNLIGVSRRGYWRAQLGAFGLDSQILPNVVIHSPKNVEIGNHVVIGEFVHIWGGGGVRIGDDVAIATHVVITSETHDKYAQLFRDSHQVMPVVIEQNVWIGSGAVILPGVRIGEGSVIAAQSVVTKDVPPRSVALGVPARVVERLELK